MSLKGEFFIALRNFQNYRRGALSYRSLAAGVLTIAFSMLPVLVVLEVSSGMIEGITRRYVEVGSFHLQAGVYGTSLPEEAEELQARLEEIPGLLSVVLLVQGNGLVYSSTSRAGTQVRGVEGSYYRRDPEFSRYLSMTAGDFDFGEDRRGLVLSRPMAEELGLEVGAPVKLLIARTSAATGRTILRPGNYYVSGIFSTGYSELDLLTIYMDKDQALSAFGAEGTLHFGFKTGDYTQDLAPLQREIRRVLPSEWYLIPWREMDRSLYQNLASTKAMLLFIMVIIILVAAVNTSSSMLNMVMERQEEIGILKSLGMSPASVEREVFFSGLIIGFLGILLGNVMGLLLAVNINSLISFIESLINGVFRLFNQEAFTLLNPQYYLEIIPIRIPLPETLLIGGLTMTCCLLASYFPARRAGRTPPLEVIRRR
ncbi:MAG: ABC transporter permease [Spirochaetales bacterium]|jgi:lipoprotein-releasing system permease protein|nr:ABC transporter permease [Spirochaetales bacterium]